MYASERDLIAGYINGDTSAFFEIDGWVGKVVGHARGLDENSRQDLQNEVHLAVLANLQKDAYRGDGILPRYVMSIAKRSYADHCRRSFGGLVDYGVEIESISPELNPEEELLRKERLAMVVGALEELGSPCCEILVRLLGDGEKSESILKDYRMTYGSFRVKVARCKDKLRSICENVGYDW